MIFRPERRDFVQLEIPKSKDWYAKKLRFDCACLSARSVQREEKLCHSSGPHYFTFY